jgi:hypothetical protein
MSDAISLKEAERKIFTAATQDGLLDVFLGCIFLMWVFAPFMSPSLGDFLSVAIFVPFWGLVMFGIWLVRRRVVRPRIGVVKFGSARKTKLLRFNLVAFAINAVAMIAGLCLALNSDAMSGRLTSVLFGFICLMLFSVAAYFLDFSRLYIYGLLVGLSPLVGEWLWANWRVAHHGFPLTFGISSAVMILTGLFVFVRLLRANPVPDDNVRSGGA